MQTFSRYTVEKVARKLGISVEETNELLQPTDLSWIQDITNVAKVEEAFNSSPKGSKAEKLLLEKWISLSKQELDLATTFAEARKVWEEALENTEAAVLALKRMIALSTTTEEAEDAYGIAKDGDLELPALEKWLSLCHDIDAIIEIYDGLPEDHDFKIKIAEKWLSLCTTIEEVVEVYRATTPGSAVKISAFKKWLSLCTTIEEAEEAFDEYPDDNEEMMVLAIDKWLSFCETADEIGEIYRTIDNDEIADKAILERWEKRSAQEIAHATNINEAKAAFESTPNDTETEKIGFKGWLNFCNNEEEAREAYEEVSDLENSELIILAINRWLLFCEDLSEIETLYSTVPDDDEIEYVVLARWNEVAVKKVQQATSVDELKKIFNSAPNGWSAKELAVRRIYDLI